MMMSKMVCELAHRTRIPNLDGLRATTGYTQIPFDTSDPRYYELCVDVRDCGIAGVNHYHGKDPVLPDNPPYHKRFRGSIPQLYVRTGFAKKLMLADSIFRGYGCRLFVRDAWRPPEVQADLFDWVMEDTRAQHPTWSDDEVVQYARQYASEARTDPRKPSPHLTAAAADVELQWLDGEIVPMGTHFDDFSPLAWTDAFEMRYDEQDDEPRFMRRIFYWVFTLLGCRVNPKELWHISEGDQLWAQQVAHEILLRTGQRVVVPAFYSSIDPRL